MRPNTLRSHASRFPPYFFASPTERPRQSSTDPGASFQFGRTSTHLGPRGFSFFRFRRACIRLSPPLLGFISATFCEAIELRRNVPALVELDWLSGIVSDANQLAAQGLNRLNVLHVNANGTGFGQSILDKVKRRTDRTPLRRRLCRLRIRHHRRAGRVLGG